MSRYHLKYQAFTVSRFPEGILTGTPIKKTEVRLVNKGIDYRHAAHNTTSRCLRVKREAEAFAALPARQQGKSILAKMGSALGRVATFRVEDGVATRQDG